MKLSQIGSRLIEQTKKSITLTKVILIILAIIFLCAGIYIIIHNTIEELTKGSLTRNELMATKIPGPFLCIIGLILIICAVNEKVRNYIYTIKI